VFVWEDLNKNGRRDGNEPPLAGALIQVFAPETAYRMRIARMILDEPIDSCITDASGFCSFELAVGSYAVVETNPRGYTSTTSDGLTVEVREGEVTEVFFGDAADHRIYLPVMFHTYGVEWPWPID